MRRQASQRARKADDLDLLIGSRLRRRRFLLAISQEELARRIGLSFQQLQKYEVGEEPHQRCSAVQDERAVGGAHRVVLPPGDEHSLRRMPDENDTDDE